MLYTISYVSTSAELSDFQINELLHITKLKNEDLGITGILMYSDQNFFQIIEGQKKVIKCLYQKIEKDIRHFNLIRILDRSINIPSFTSFQSTYTIVNREKDYSDLQQFLEIEKIYNPKNFKNISYLVNKFMKLT
ncbi:BLUF domain-containing protein [Aquimarina sp. AD1]|uniref:BLUF domain-containing protein n=1 Tax=Aquimarina sp. (strain AD1) TaxID=1714848 RepID=UPI000E4F5D67|nr:BLUF domain-containing protein [Aquimarina sp. AD1]AXT58237.1 BLUF domain-containing protein [Aquimarina sp. AD1]RKN16965.1 BLUF domain-containing protein [Aquimarina sp. AD1]